MSAQATIAIVINPSKNHADDALALLRERLAALGAPDPLVHETTVEDAGASQTRAALEAGADVVIAAGGDGTVRAVAAELLDRTDVVLGILPLGTGNLLARNLGIDVDDLDRALDAILEGPTEPLDALRIDSMLADHSEQQHISLVAAGMGIDAEVMMETNEQLKKFVGPAAYTATAVGKMLGWHRHPVRVSVDGGAWETARARTVMLANAGYIQGGIQYAPGVRLDDGRQQAVIMTPKSMAGWALVAAKTLLRLRTDVPVMMYLTGQTITVRPFYALAAQVDGDPIGEVTSLRSTVLRHALRVRVPVEDRRLPPGGPLVKILPTQPLSELPPVTEVVRWGERTSGAVRARLARLVGRGRRD